MIVIEALHKVYPGPTAGWGEIVALDHVSFTVRRGTIHGIVGTAGAGKSTLVRCLTMLERPTSGRVVIDGVDVAAAPDARLWAVCKRIGLLLGRVNLLAARTVAQAVAHPLEVAGVPLAKRAIAVHELLSLVGLPGRSDAYPDELSASERQRVGLAQALATDPAVLICDDPTAALPCADAAGMLALIADIRDRTGLTVVVASEDAPTVRAVCDTVTRLERGQIVRDVPVPQRERAIGQLLGAGLAVNGAA